MSSRSVRDHRNDAEASVRAASPDLWISSPGVHCVTAVCASANMKTAKGSIPRGVGSAVLYAAIVNTGTVVGAPGAAALSEGNTDGAGETFGFCRTHISLNGSPRDNTSRLVRDHVACRAVSHHRLRPGDRLQATAHPVCKGVQPLDRLLREPGADLRRPHVSPRGHRAGWPVHRGLAHRVQPEH